MKEILFGSIVLPCTLLVASLTPAAANAREQADVPLYQEVHLATCIHRASAGRPWLAKTLWALRDQEGGWVGATVQNRDGSHDLGPLQINSWWVPKIAKMTGRRADHVRWWLIHDICFNVEAARWIFLSELARHRSYWKAIGSYHSPDPSRQRTYAHEVAGRLKTRFGYRAFFTR